MDIIKFRGTTLGRDRPSALVVFVILMFTWLADVNQQRSSTLYLRLSPRYTFRFQTS